MSYAQAPRLLTAAIAVMAVTAVLPGIAVAQTTNDVGARLERLERSLGNKGLLDLARQVEMLQQEVRQLRGELETQVYALEQVRKSQREAYLDAERRIGVLESGGAVAPGPGVPVDPPLPTLATPADSTVAGTPSDQTIGVDVQPLPGVAAAPGAVPAATAPAGAMPAPGDGTSAVTAAPVMPAPQPSILPSGPSFDNAESEAAYRDAFGMLKAGQYDQSIAAFNGFLQKYPSSQYADNAQYWLGEAYYVMRQFEPAIEQYQKLVNGFPDSKKQSHAMLKIAYSYHELGLGEQAIGVLTELKNRFPGSAAARLADERLQRIRSESL